MFRVLLHLYDHILLYFKEYLPDRSKNVTFKILYVVNNTKTGFMNFVVIVLFTGTYCTLPIFNKS